MTDTFRHLYKLIGFHANINLSRTIRQVNKKYGEIDLKTNQYHDQGE